jgi:hypothetical protein
MKKSFDKKSSSSLAKKPEKPQISTPAAGATPAARPDRAPQHKGKKAAVRNMPGETARHVSIAEGEAGSLHGATNTPLYCSEHN